ncbi:MAG TPA: hypothetical protein VG387_16510 [Rhizomicrobium sp.]|jgi:hypothetical protein|nr:hypothetical protein [Rhizomicrobium sp.]
MNPEQQPVPGIPGAVMRQVDHVSDELPGGLPAGPRMFAKPGQLLLAQPGIGRFLSTDGGLIEFSVDEAADEGMVTLLLHGTARGALIHQRGELPFHACTLVPPGGGRAIAICGRSGAGKSTLGAELSRRGWRLVADDTTRVTWQNDHPLAWPSRDSIKLWKDACESAGIDVSKLERVAQALEKFYIHVASVNEPVRLGTIIELTPDGADKPALSAGDKMALVSRHTYRPSNIRPLGMQAQHVRIVAQTAAACRVLRLPSDRSKSVREMADAVEAAVR